ncbi:MAG: hypothetical protein DRP16_02175 [Candidatus Aenigmatarchaeota archaeon]|nr:MAG: hypothetical protein DRP16_02175 [Candidatus Aenigmarchaeota archaeon]
MILVTGGTGYIGRNLVEKLLFLGYKVRLLSRNPEITKYMFPEADVVEGDVLKKSNLEIAVSGVSEVIHLAGLVSYTKPKDEIFHVNVDGTKNLIEVCVELGVKRIIFSSSVSVYGPVEHVVTERTQPNPVNPYGESKLEAEKLILESGIPYVILRFAPVYGEGSPVWAKKLKLLERFPVPDTKNLTQLVNVFDAVHAFEIVLKKKDILGTYLIADKKPIKFVEFAEMLVRELGKKPVKVPYWFAKFLSKVSGFGDYFEVLTMNRNYDITRAETELGFKPKANMKEEIKKMVKWYRMTKMEEAENILKRWTKKAGW